MHIYLRINVCGYNKFTVVYIASVHKYCCFSHLHDGFHCDVYLWSHWVQVHWVHVTRLDNTTNQIHTHASCAVCMSGIGDCSALYPSALPYSCHRVDVQV